MSDDPHDRMWFGDGEELQRDPDEPPPGVIVWLIAGIAAALGVVAWVVLG